MALLLEDGFLRNSVGIVCLTRKLCETRCSLPRDICLNAVLLSLIFSPRLLAVDSLEFALVCFVCWSCHEGHVAIKHRCRQRKEGDSAPYLTIPSAISIYGAGSSRSRVAGKSGHDE